MEAGADIQLIPQSIALSAQRSRKKTNPGTRRGLDFHPNDATILHIVGRTWPEEAPIRYATPRSRWCNVCKSCGVNAWR